MSVYKHTHRKEPPCKHVFICTQRESRSWWTMGFSFCKSSVSSHCNARSPLLAHTSRGSVPPSLCSPVDRPERAGERREHLLPTARLSGTADRHRAARAQAGCGSALRVGEGRPEEGPCSPTRPRSPRLRDLVLKCPGRGALRHRAGDRRGQTCPWGRPEDGAGSPCPALLAAPGLLPAALAAAEARGENRRKERPTLPLGSGQLGAAAMGVTQSLLSAWTRVSVYTGWLVVMS